MNKKKKVTDLQLMLFGTRSSPTVPSSGKANLFYGFIISLFNFFLNLFPGSFHQVFSVNPPFRKLVCTVVSSQIIRTQQISNPRIIWDQFIKFFITSDSLRTKENKIYLFIFIILLFLILSIVVQMKNQLQCSHLFHCFVVFFFLFQSYFLQKFKEGEN